MKRIVCFTFANGTQLRVAVDEYFTPPNKFTIVVVVSKEPKEFTFDEMVHKAKQLIWNQRGESVDNKDNGRGDLVKIELEGYIYV